MHTKIATSLFLVFVMSLCVLGNYEHARQTKQEFYPRKIWDHSIYSTDWLKQQLHRSDRSWHSWRVMGQSLHALFYTGGTDDVKIAASPAGAISFYSGLPVYDLLGLNAREVASAGNPFNPRLVGHLRIATNEQITAAGVNLLVWHGSALCKQGDIYKAIPSAPARYHPLKRHRTVLLPSADSCYLVADYITPHPHVEMLLTSGIILDYRQHQDVMQCPKWLCLR